MTNSRLHAAIALGSALIVAAFVFLVPPIPPVTAQSHAQRICREQGIGPPSEVYKYCLSQAIRVLEWGEPKLARRFARVAVDAQEACLGYGLQPQTSGFRTCIDREFFARSLLVSPDARASVRPN
jgi:hypothetical protein